MVIPENCVFNIAMVMGNQYYKSTDHFYIQILSAKLAITNDCSLNYQQS